MAATDDHKGPKLSTGSGSGGGGGGGGAHKMSASAASQPDSDKDSTDDKKRLNLKAISEGIGIIILTPAGFLHAAVYNVITSQNYEVWQTLSKELGIKETDFAHAHTSPKLRLELAHHSSLDQLISKAANELHIELDQFLHMIGDEYFSLAYEEHGYALSFLGSTFQDFLASVDIFKDQLNRVEAFTNVTELPVFYFEAKKDAIITLTYHAVRPLLRDGNFMAGLLERAGQLLFNIVIESAVEISIVNPVDAVLINFSLRQDRAHPSDSPAALQTQRRFLRQHPEQLSRDPRALPISMKVFCAAFPFHIVLNRQMRIIQLGNGINRILSQGWAHKISVGGGKVGCGGAASSRPPLDFASHFNILLPAMKAATFEDVQERLHAQYKLQIRTIAPPTYKAADYEETARDQTLELKGQMAYVKESDVLLFIGSPLVDRLEDLTNRGLFISDLPIHDATRDVILMGEQTKAQDSLKKRMNELKDNIEEAHRALDDERQKNVNLLYMIFPPDVAKRLWLGEPVEAERKDNVTLLFSDIVGFTSICGSASPIQVIEMLNSLYTKFDRHVAEVDIYKVETIGDAFICVGNLHRISPYHAQQVAFMAFLMMMSASESQSPSGERIHMRIGLHTGTILAGVVGIKMPRYCMFGSDVTLGNKFESQSEADRINVSPTTHKLLLQTPGFKFTERPRDTLPDGFPHGVRGHPQFLDDYQNPQLADEQPTLLESILAALKEFKIQAGNERVPTPNRVLNVQ